MREQRASKAEQPLLREGSNQRVKSLDDEYRLRAFFINRGEILSERGAAMQVGDHLKAAWIFLRGEATNKRPISAGKKVRHQVLAFQQKWGRLEIICPLGQIPQATRVLGGKNV